MKTQDLVLCLLIALSGHLSAQGVSLNSTGAPPHVSSILDISSTSEGLLPPRMTKPQRDAITNPIPGLIIWCNNCIAPAGELQVFNGIKWTNMVGGTSPTNLTLICDQLWATKNLDVTRYRNGDPIPKVTDPAEWASLTTGAYCYYNNDSTNYAATYGKLYNWYAVNDPRGLAPEGWHIPSNDEWFTLMNSCLGGDDGAGGPLKETGLLHWNPPNAGATNSTGFTGLPGGIRSYNGAFGVQGMFGHYWSSTDLENSTAMYIWLSTNDDDVQWNGFEFFIGLSVRCIRD